MDNKEIFNVFFREKPAMMLVELKNAKSEVYASSLAKSVDCTYSHVVKIGIASDRLTNDIAVNVRQHIIENYQVRAELLGHYAAVIAA